MPLEPLVALTFELLVLQHLREMKAEDKQLERERDERLERHQ